jgi:hypothetical protein
MMAKGREKKREKKRKKKKRFPTKQTPLPFSLSNKPTLTSGD